MILGFKDIQKKATGEVNTRETWLEKKIEDVLQEESNVPKGGYFQVSAIGDSCDRYLYLHYHGLLKTEMFSGRQIRIFEHGNVTQERFERYFKKIGWYKDREVTINSENPPLHGRSDIILSINNEDYIIEMKTINNEGFAKLKTAKPEHETQIQVYLNLLNINRGSVLYENKNTQEILAFAQKKDSKKWKQIVDRCNYIIGLKELPKIEDIKHMPWCKCKDFDGKREVLADTTGIL